MGPWQNRWKCVFVHLGSSEIGTTWRMYGRWCFGGGTNYEGQYARYVLRRKWAIGFRTIATWIRDESSERGSYRSLDQICLTISGPISCLDETINERYSTSGGKKTKQSILPFRSETSGDGESNVGVSPVYIISPGLFARTSNWTWINSMIYCPNWMTMDFYWEKELISIKYRLSSESIVYFFQCKYNWCFLFIIICTFVSWIAEFHQFPVW